MFSFRDFVFPVRSEIRFSFQTMKGIGFWKSFFICAKVGIGFPFFFPRLNNYLFLLLCFFFKKLAIVQTHVQRKFKRRLQKWLKNRYVRAKKYVDYLPVRGQRSRTNNGTRKRERLKKIQMRLEREIAAQKAEKEQKEEEKKKRKEEKKQAKLKANHEGKVIV